MPHHLSYSIEFHTIRSESLSVRNTAVFCPTHTKKLQHAGSHQERREVELLACPGIGSGESKRPSQILAHEGRSNLVFKEATRSYK